MWKCVPKPSPRWDTWRLAERAWRKPRQRLRRALGILRGGAAIPDLVQALHSKDNQTMYEALIALQKIRDVSAGPRAAFLLHDLEEKIQLTAIETTGLLGNREALPDLRDVLDHTHSAKVRRAAVVSLAMLAVTPDHALFQKSLSDNDDAIRAAGAEGLGRLKDPADRAALDKAFNAEHKLNTRLSMAFALVSLGNLDMGEFGPFRYLINTLNQRSYRGSGSLVPDGISPGYDGSPKPLSLAPLARPKDEEDQAESVLSRSGERDSLPYLETLQMDPDPEVAQESIRSLRALRARLP